ncbi:penicillin acylase family protein [Phenylobacterium aquaticum]|uniref:penicillin acylase family protein n=1 Tax=Phenylobacterium aquaticum TaxID=1763816 RepID=UPI0026F25199|nr:penicillin acylase family protein [Phenylobacterium aquaticum]
MKRLGLITFAIAVAASRALAAPATEAHAVAGLEKPAEIRVDRWGIPHIYAGSVRDAFFLQGYNVARDRLWQVDLWRKRGLGLLAKDFGPDYVAQDRAARLFLYRGDMKVEWASYGPDARSSTEAFTAGINAYVGEIRAGTRPLPMEFKLAGSQPDLWSPDDVVRIRSQGLTRNVPNEVGRAHIACAGGLEAAKLYKNIEPAWTTKIPEGLDPCDIPANVLDDYQRGTAGVKFSGPPERRSALDVPPEAIGSNNWTIAGSHTDTGRPILANDPHREHSVPSLRYIVQLEAPGFSVIGAGEPALPGVSIGHNDTSAFGLTIFPADQEDLYVYETNPKDPDLYRYGQGWERMRTVREALTVKGEAKPRTIVLKFTRHGPVIHASPDKHRAFALRSVWAAPGTSAYFGSTGYMGAKSWEAFKAALEHWGSPSVNQVYADTAGHIGWVAAARVPRRPNWDGLTPVPGDGRYEWNGFLKADELPSAADPAKGWIATANAMNLPDGYPVAERKVGFEWTNASRLTRISEVLAANPKVSIADAMALQTDPTNVGARPVIALLGPLSSEDRRLNEALTLLRAWNLRTEANSAAAVIYEAWAGKHLGGVLIARTAPAAARPILGQGDIAAVTAYLQHPDAALGPDPAAARDAVLLDSLSATLDELATRMGPDLTTWSWGRLHVAEFHHALTPLAGPAQRAAMSAGPAPMGGTALSPMAATWREDDFHLTAGASFRMVLDVGGWDNSRVINTPGQSGDPDSPHYRDLFPLWVSGQYAPLVYSRAAVEAATERVITLTPAPAPARKGLLDLIPRLGRSG